MPKVSGRMPKYSHFWETAAGDRVRSSLHGAMAVVFRYFSADTNGKSGVRLKALPYDSGNRFRGLISFLTNPGASPLEERALRSDLCPCLHEFALARQVHGLCQGSNPFTATKFHPHLAKRNGRDRGSEPSRTGRRARFLRADSGSPFYPQAHFLPCSSDRKHSAIISASLALSRFVVQSEYGRP